jgi:nucleoporin NUP42
MQKPQASTTTPAAAASSPFGAQTTQSASPFGQAASQPQQQAQPAAAAGSGKEIDPKDRFKEGKKEEYEGEQGRILEEIYRRVGQMGRFNDDEEIPLTPPRCEWIVPIPIKM